WSHDVLTRFFFRSVLSLLLCCGFLLQQFIGCAFNNEGQVSRFWRYGYDGRDIMHVDLAKEAVVATSEPGQLLAEERKSKEYIKRKEARLVKVCSAVKTVFLKSNNSLSRAGKSAVYHCNLDAFDAHIYEYLKCAVHGFYPNIIRVRWTQNRRPVYFGVSTTGVLPHKDGTFQMISYLSLSNVSAQSVTCEIEHLSIDGILRIAYGKNLCFYHKSQRLYLRQWLPFFSDLLYQ
uniref:Hereditary hemochromatosis protein homolog n=1 Tax=Sinocyclocheilus rhinocerous TaxID=307959 RepID=A0A673NPX5_9TELE